MDPIIQLQHIEKSFGSEPVVKGINLDVERGEFLTILGPSGCGKTTTLRMIAGFEEPDNGQILLERQNVVGIPPYKRDVNTVFQSYALFPHMTIHDNIAYGLRMKGVPKPEIVSRVKEGLRLVQLESFGDRKPSQLSGGQQQRVAVARALVNNPKVLLLDEPLGALDLKLRKQMQIELKQLQQKLEITFIYVTHDQEEALTISDRIVVMNKGVIEQTAAPQEIYDSPRTKFVADFIGDTNLLEVKPVSQTQVGVMLDFSGTAIEGRMGVNQRISDAMYLSVRPEKVQISHVPTGLFTLQGTVDRTIFVGSFHKTIVNLTDGSRIVASAPSLGGMSYRPGDQVWVTWRGEDGIVIGA